MQVYYFYQHPTQHFTYIQIQPDSTQEAEFIWVDCHRDDVINDTADWQHKIEALTGLSLNEYHIRDILNLEHPCVFDSLEDYDLMIFRKLVTPDDHILIHGDGAEQHERVFGLVTTPMSFIMSSRCLVSVREQGNKSFEAYSARLDVVASRSIETQNNPRKLPNSGVDLLLRLLGSVLDDYLDLRMPLTKRVEYWQQALLQGHRRFTQWHQLLQENMAFQQIENLCEEQIDVLQELADEIVDNYPHLRAKNHPERQDILLVRLKDLSSHIERIQKHSTRFRTTIQSTIDLHFSAISNQTNENMRFLAIITAVFAPLTLLTGIYGMNFEFIPGLSSAYGFWLMLGCMLMTTLGLLYYFYRRHLLGRGEGSVVDLLAQQHQDRKFNFFWFLDHDMFKNGSIKANPKLDSLKKNKSKSSMPRR